jgi:hypothetical protein
VPLEGAIWSDAVQDRRGDDFVDVRACPLAVIGRRGIDPEGLGMTDVERISREFTSKTAKTASGDDRKYPIDCARRS